MKISWGQFMILTLMCRIFTVMTYIPLIGEGYSALTQMLAILISTVIQGIMVIPLIIITKKYSGIGFFDLFGKGILPAVIACIYILFAVLIAVKSSASFINFITTVFFPAANPILILFVLIGVCVYCAYLGTEALARSAPIIFVFFIIMLLAMGVSSLSEIRFYRFAEESGWNVSSLFGAVLDDLSRNGDILLAVFLLNNVKGGIRKGFFGALAGKLIILEVISTFIITVLGGYSRMVDFPLYSLGSFSGVEILGRYDAVYMVVWTMTAIIKISIFIGVSSEMMRNVFKISKMRNSVIGAAVFILGSIIVAGNNNLLTLCNSITGAVPLIIMFFVIPLILTGGNHREKTDPGYFGDNGSHSAVHNS